MKAHELCVEYVNDVDYILYGHQTPSYDEENIVLECIEMSEDRYLEENYKDWKNRPGHKNPGLSFLTL